MYHIMLSAEEAEFPEAACVSEVIVSTHHSSAGISCVPRGSCYLTFSQASPPWHSPAPATYKLLWSRMLLTGLIICPWTVPRKGYLQTKALSPTLFLGILNLCKTRCPGYGSGYILCSFTDRKCRNKHKTQQIGELQYFHRNSLA